MSDLSDGQVVNLMQALDELDEQIATLQASKRDLFEDAREQMTGMAKKDIALRLAAIKKVVADERKARNNPEAVERAEERDSLADHYRQLLILAPARRATCAVMPSLGEIKSAFATSRNSSTEQA